MVCGGGASPAQLVLDPSPTPHIQNTQYAGVKAAAEAGGDAAMDVDGASPNKKGGSSSKYKMDLGPEDGKLEVVSPLADGLGAFGELGRVWVKGRVCRWAEIHGPHSIDH